MLKLWLRDSIVYAIPAFVSRGVALFLVPLYTRVLSPADYGSLDLFTVFAGIINLTIALEVSQGLARYYAGEPNPERKIIYASSAFWFSFFCNTAFVVGALLLTPQLAPIVMGRPGLDTEFEIGLIYIWAGSMFYLVQNQLRWELRSRHYAIVSLLMVLATAAASLCLTVVVRWGLVGLLLGMVIGSVVATVVGLWWLRRSFQFRFGATELGEMLTFSAPLVVSGIAVWANLYIDRIMISHFFSVEEVGIYGIGYRLASVAGILIIGFQSSLTPLVYAHYRDPETPVQIARIFRIFVTISLSVFLCLSLSADQILVIMTAPSFYDASELILYLIPAVMLGGMYVFSPGIGISNKTYIVVLINACAFFVNVALNYILIARIGVTGVAISTLVSAFGMFLAYVLIGQRYYPVPHRWMPIILAVLLSVTLTVLLSALHADKWVEWIAKAMGLICLLAACLRLGLVSKEEIRVGLVSLQARICNRSSE